MTESNAEKKLRYLCSCDAERMSDYQRINHFITASCAVLAEMRALKKVYMDARQEVANHFHLYEVKAFIEKVGQNGSRSKEVVSDYNDDGC